MKRRSVLVLPFAGVVATACGVAGGAGDYSALVALHDEFLEFDRPAMENGLPDFRPETIERQRAGLDGFADRLDAIDPAGWPVAQQVDYLLVRARLNRLDYDLRVRRPWARDPGTYVDTAQRLAFHEFPIGEEAIVRLGTQLAGIPAFLSLARENLTDAGGELTMLALRNLVTADGVGHGHPYREVPPAGTIAWYEDLVGQLETHHPELLPRRRRRRRRSGSSTPGSPGTGTAWTRPRGSAARTTTGTSSTSP